MIIKLLPDQIAKIWDTIRFGLLKAWPIGYDDKSENVQAVLRNLLAETVQCWAIYEGDEVIGFILTRINVCDISGTRSLLILTLYAFKPLSEKVWEGGFAALRDFARGNDCKFVTATSVNERVLAMARKYNFTLTQFISLEV